MATISDVARVAGVSISTVSAALSGKRHVASDTRSRIEAVARTMGYHPNAGARMLAGTRAQMLALSAPLHADTSTPAHMRFVLAVTTAARAHGYDTLLLVEDEAAAGIERVSASALADGIVVMDVDARDRRADQLRSGRYPAVFLGVPDDPTGLRCVDLDFAAAARLCLDRLAGLGHRAVGLVGQPEVTYERGTNYARVFRDAFVAHAAATGLRCEVVTPEPGRLGADAALPRLRRLLPDVSAVVLNASELTTHRFVRSCLEAGLRIPGDLSLVVAGASFDTSDDDVPLDTVPLPAATMGARAVQLLVDRIEGASEPVVERLAPTYVERGSVAAPDAA
ncbi:MAG: LacI family DNA-binding transcriptional regulator [Micrococcales bacterium]|uniref:LacI family DNA-binding transcriptional regulator n=1 Tax=Cellulomonas sp. P4 TaxID=3142533 RepID=UPI0019C4BBDA|nr:LacI family DNA-binding transcriptional regulator [Micrococcales bacterium]